MNGQSLTFNGQTAILKHEIGLSYIAYLMSHPNEPIHGLALALKVKANGPGCDVATEIANPETGVVQMVQLTP